MKISAININQHGEQKPAAGQLPHRVPPSTWVVLGHLGVAVMTLGLQKEAI